jgi:hypothetical protein
MWEEKSDGKLIGGKIRAEGRCVNFDRNASIFQMK